MKSKSKKRKLARRKTGYLGGELSIAGIDLARFQGISKCAHHSTSRCGNDVIDRRGM
jgi:hypothetical protein